MKRLIAFICTILMLVGVVAVLEPTSVSAATKPKAPTNVTVSQNKNGQAVITWKKVSNASGYRVYVKTPSSSKYVKLGNTTKLKLTDKKNAYANGTCYKVKAYAKDANGKKLWSKFSKAFKISNAQGDTKDNKNGTKVSKEYDVNHFKPFKEVTSTFNTVKLSDSFGSGDFSFKSGQLILGDVYSGVFSSWLAENSLFGEQDAFDFLSEEQIAEFNKINIIPTISKTNTKGLTTETILGSKEEATEILDAWMKARSVQRINDKNKDDDYVYRNLYGVTSYTIEDDGNILFKSYSGKMGIGVNTSKFGEPVYSVGLWLISDGQMDDKDIADQKLANIELLSLISNNPYDLTLKLSDGNEKTAPIFTIYDEWYRINDMLIYHDSGTNRVYMKPVS